METRKNTLYVGLNDKDTKKQEIDTLEAVKIATNIICRIVDGCTIYNATGIYHHEDGQIVIENSLRIEIINAAAAAISEIVSSLKAALNQESIIVQADIINSYIA